MDFVAREQHFFEHLRPTWEALPPRSRGRFYVGQHVSAEGIDATTIETHRTVPEGRGLAVVASYRDLKFARRLGRRVVVSEHGAGQTYNGVETGSYIGATDRAGVVAVLAPSERAAEISRDAHPTIPVHVVGVPYLDRWHREPRREWDPAAPTVALSFHWRCQLAPEARGAWRHYRTGFLALSRAFPLLGHFHPRAREHLEPYYRRNKIEVVPDWAEVIERADIFVCDNSSTIFEWASLDRPVVVLNAPTFRRHVEHGLRFWEFADVGVQAESPRDWIEAIKVAATDPPKVAARRREIVREVYAHTDGDAAERAARALLSVEQEWG